MSFHVQRDRLAADIDPRRERVATILSAEPVRQMTAYAASPSSPEDISPTTPATAPVPLSPCGGKINWTTLQVEPEDDYASAPEFVDVSKISYHSQLPKGLYDTNASSRVAHECRRVSGLRFGETASPVGGVENEAGQLRNEAGRSVYSFEEMLCRPPQWPPAGARARNSVPSAPRLSKRAHSLAEPSDRSYNTS